MCGRFVSPDEAAFEREWSLLPPIHNYFQSFNVAPSQEPVVIYDTENTTSWLRMTWQFQPPWATRPMINARSETVFEKPMFRQAVRKTRCIVPVAGWYEWDRSGAKKQPYYHTHAEGRSFGLAGIYTLSDDLGTTKRLSFALLTRDSNDWAAKIHHRMPLVIHPDHHASWLSTQTSASDVQDIISAPIDDGELFAYRVSTKVNSPKNNSRDCIDRVRDQSK